MQLPRSILIDTNIFDKYGYNFSAKAIEKFVSIAQRAKLTLLLPDAIERELTRHIHAKSAEVRSALKKARQDAPFLRKWTHWPTPEQEKAAKDVIAASYIADLNRFLQTFEVERLGYAGIDMVEVMNWHDQQSPPFGPGAKGKEFPDAFALASCLAYARTKRAKVAVLSADADFQKFSASHPELVHFGDLPSLTEALLAEMDTDARIEVLKAVILANLPILIEQVHEDFPELDFYPEEDPEGDVSGVEVKSVAISDVRIIGLEACSSTIAFAADVRFSAYVEYGDPDSMIIDSSEDIRVAIHTLAGKVVETTRISATATVEFSSDFKSTISAHGLKMGEEAIAVQTRPPECDDPEDRDQP
jgi:hypothetical protein